MSGATSAQKRGGSCQVGVVAFQLGLARWMDIESQVSKCELAWCAEEPQVIHSAIV
jgi:hypothetical protein